jgi:hypothetical protein
MGMWVKSLGDDAVEAETRAGGARRPGSAAGGGHWPGLAARGVAWLTSRCGRLGTKCVGGATGGLYSRARYYFEIFSLGRILYTRDMYRILFYHQL